MRRRISKLLNKVRYLPGMGRIMRPVIHRQMNKTVDKLADHFFEHFSLVVAVNEQQRRACYNIRHKVYCEEMGFEPCQSTQLERDEYDDYAISCYIKHKASGDGAGTIRIVVPQARAQSLPLEQVCCLPEKDMPVMQPDCGVVGEISRLAIPSRFRRRPSDGHFAAVAGKGDEQTFPSLEPGRHFPYLSVALYFLAANLCFKRGIETVYVMMEPKLARRLKMLGVRFRQAGEPVEYHGLRAAYCLSAEEFQAQIPPSLVRFQQRIRDYIDTSYDRTLLSSLPLVASPALKSTHAA